MPRKLRQFEIGNVCHIIKRGVEKRKIFMSNQDYSRFIFGLEFCNSTDHINLWPILAREGRVRAGARAGSDPARAIRIIEARSKKREPLVEILAFSLMPNHFHLILREIIMDGIIKFMQKLGGYSMYFNKQHKRTGTLFEGRYKAVLAKDDAQLSSMFVYVHTNQVELWEPRWKDFKVENPQEAIRKLEKYGRSSYNDYIGKPQFPEVINRDFFLKFYGGEKKCQQAVEEWIRYKGEHE